MDPATEPYAYTDADGNYTIDSSASAPLVVITDDSKIAVGSGLTISAVNTASGVAVDGLTMKAPAGSAVVTPTTTLIQETGKSASEIAQVLGLGDVDLLSYNPYAEGVSATDETALKIGRLQSQIVTTVKSMAAAAEAQGVDAALASETAFASVATVVDNSASIDFADSDDLDAIVTQTVADLTTVVNATGGSNAANFNTAMTALKSAARVVPAL